MPGAPDLSRPKPKAKSSTAKAHKDRSGLGRAIINRRAKEQKRLYEEALHTTELPSGLDSVTQENDLDTFLNTAQLAATDFTAEKQNVRILNPTSTSTTDHYLLTKDEEKELKVKHDENRKRLKVPRRPDWSKETAKDELERRERESFLEWRKSLAEMEDSEQILLTPFERNLAVWRQLWRTLERSHLVVQIVDARNPLTFRCTDLEDYVKEVGDQEQNSDAPNTKGKRRNLILVNKADLLTQKQREGWADYFDSQGIKYTFYSAAMATKLQEEELLAAQNLSRSAAELEIADSDDESEEDSDEDPATIPEATTEETSTEVEEEEDLRTRILSVHELEELFIKSAPNPAEFYQPNPKFSTAPRLCIGLVGYPNVGKSSTINSLLGSKKVSVSSTPGKTKNFQTIHLSLEIILCDCPGLVFPQFANTKAGMVCDGVLPIDQMREWNSPTELVIQRIPRETLEKCYGIRIHVPSIEEGGTGIFAASHLLSAYASARGFSTQGIGNPDESRAARLILKDYVNGKLLYCHPPPGLDADEFNAESRSNQLAHLRFKGIDKNLQNSGKLVRDDDESRSTYHDSPASTTSLLPTTTGKIQHQTGRVQIYPHQRMLGSDGLPVKSSTNEGIPVNSKKHGKGNRRRK